MNKIKEYIELYKKHKEKVKLILFVVFGVLFATLNIFQSILFLVGSISGLLLFIILMSEENKREVKN